ncbi:MAG: hypothetical protein JRJ60_17310 [Deltaproteobacteria bacterium]|nr:hypothetical protein [Deltaproteobacteria bacterium]
MKGKGRVDLVRFRPDAAADFFPPKFKDTLSEAEANGRISFEMDGPEHLEATLTCSLPRLVLNRDGRSVKASVKNLEEP